MNSNKKIEFPDGDFLPGINNYCASSRDLCIYTKNAAVGVDKTEDDLLNDVH
jgi:hypothetical protein